MGRGIRPGAIRNPPVRLDLNDRGADSACSEGGAQKSMGGSHRVNRQLFYAHRETVTTDAFRE